MEAGATINVRQSSELHGYTYVCEADVGMEVGEPKRYRTEHALT